MIHECCFCILCVAFISLQKKEPLQARVGKYVQESPSFGLSLQQIIHHLFTEKEIHGQYDTDDNSDMDRSTSTDTKSTAFSGVSYYSLHNMPLQLTDFLFNVH